VETASQCAALASDPRVEVVVSINPLGFETEGAASVLDALKAIPNLRIEIQPSPRSTAESSAMNSIGFAQNDWVWFVGDDDNLSKNAITEILLMIDKPVDFWLLNCVLNYLSGFSSKYYEVGPRREQVGLGKDLFKKFGLVSATTTLSCLVFRKEIVDLDFFNELHDLQGIYSHSFFLFACLYNRSVGVSDLPLVQRTEGTSVEIKLGLQKYVKSKGVPFYSIFTTGLLALIEEVSKKTGIGVGEILEYRELEIIKNLEIVSNKTHRILVNRLGDFMLGFTLTALESSPILDAKLLKVQRELNEYGFRVRGQGLVMAAPVRVTLTL
jgi:hypothetical protein